MIEAARPRNLFRLVLLSVLWLLPGCTGHRGPPNVSGRQALPQHCRYDVEVLDADEFVLSVDVTCKGFEASGIATQEPALAGFLTKIEGNGEPLKREGVKWQLPESTRSLRASYQVRLGALADQSDDFDIALRRGEALVAPSYSWLMRPDPLPVGVPIELSVKTPEGVRFETGLTQVGPGRYQLLTEEVRVATYGVFGRFKTSSFSLPGQSGPAKIDVAYVGEPPSNQDVVEAWVSDVAGAVGDFWGGFPVPRTFLVMVGLPDADRVVFGKVLPASSPGVMLLVGSDVEKSDLYRDWILVHEFFHLGSPSYNGEGKWLDEGLATYYEPLIRARAGWKTEQQVWAEFSTQMWRGLGAVQGAGLERADSFRGIYWGGALVCLLADIEARKRSHGRVGLEDGLREVLRQGGSASNVWRLKDTIALIDHTLGAPTLAPLAERHAYRGNPLELGKLLRRLGVQKRDEHVLLSSETPLAQVRSWLLAPPGAE